MGLLSSKGLEALIENTKDRLLANNIKQVYVPDTNVLIASCGFAAFVLSGNKIPEELTKDRLGDLFANQAVSYSPDPNGVILLSTVDDELDHLKGRKDKSEAVRASATKAISVFEYITQLGFYKSSRELANSGIELENKALYFRFDSGDESFVKGLYNPSPDARIVGAINQLQQRLSPVKVFFVSDDMHARKKAMELGVEAQKYRFHAVRDPNQLYIGWVEKMVSGGVLKDFVKKRRLPIEDILGESNLSSIKPNQVVYMYASGQDVARVGFVDADKKRIYGFRFFRSKNFSGKKGDSGVSSQFSESEVVINKSSSFKQLSKTAKNLIAGIKDPFQKRTKLNEYNNIGQAENDADKYKRMFGFVVALEHVIGSKNVKNPVYLRLCPPYQLTRHQENVMELLLNPHISVVSILGKAGTGKTLCSLLAALMQVRDGQYQRIIYMRPLVTKGPDIGYLPGSKDEKLSAWVGPIEDTVYEIFNYDGASLDQKSAIENQMSLLEKYKILKIEPLTFMSGRTIRNAFVFVDEAHDYTQQEMKVIVGRIGRNSKLVIAGDPSQIHEMRLLSYESNGFSMILDKLPGEKLYAHYSFPDKEIKRSPVAELVAVLNR